ncbi:MAG: T9SS type A sorting domain-containing protein [Saprospiraceae bacterium]|nr:T9SS type A sorting domain-containing protein [Saprospiraceae bacterium]MCF8251133.1 T9SS type A sorting domain-containing protein [Saprospiraceae bacterium]MCF8282955.1 T9SS type A sorting domain-containing protein [Bacteroidales bacterium]MCF8312909.1 T9SS type A sorting domain-containing protein [Saprospiraceae bacterium]
MWLRDGGDTGHASNTLNKALLATPNPATDKVFVQMPQSNVDAFATVKVMTIYGKLKAVHEHVETGSIFALDVSQLTAGTYLLVTEVEGYAHTSKFVKV